MERREPKALWSLKRKGEREREIPGNKGNN
jgi:hypothetical protein